MEHLLLLQKKRFFIWLCKKNLGFRQIPHYWRVQKPLFNWPKLLKLIWNKQKISISEKRNDDRRNGRWIYWEFWKTGRLVVDVYKRQPGYNGTGSWSICEVRKLFEKGIFPGREMCRRNSWNSFLSDRTGRSFLFYTVSAGLQVCTLAGSLRKKDIRSVHLPVVWTLMKNGNYKIAPIKRIW